MRIGDDHRVFHAFGCGDGHLLARLPTKESVERQRVVWVEHPEPWGSKLLEEGVAQEPWESLGEGTVISTGMAASIPWGQAS